MTAARTAHPYELTGGDVITFELPSGEAMANVEVFDTRPAGTSTMVRVTDPAGHVVSHLMHNDLTVTLHN